MQAAGEALEIISRTLLENCAADIIRVQTQLRAKHAGGANVTWGIDGEKGTMADMNELGVWEPVAVKQQTIKTVEFWIHQLRSVLHETRSNLGFIVAFHQRQMQQQRQVKQPTPSAGKEIIHISILFSNENHSDQP
jgi:hypothetical protein